MGVDMTVRDRVVDFEEGLLELVQLDAAEARKFFVEVAQEPGKQVVPAEASRH